MSWQSQSRLVLHFSAMLASLAFAAPAFSQPEFIPSDAEWVVQPSFGQGNEGRDNVSGLTCKTLPPGRNCLVVNDGAKFAQTFVVSGTQIKPGPIVGFATNSIPANTIGTPTAEGAAHDGRFFYVVTSRGKTQPGDTDTSFLVMRFELNNAGEPIPIPTLGGNVPIQVSTRIRTALTTGIPIPQLIPALEIDRNNAHIEGIAVKDGVIHLGFRAPATAGKAFLVRVPVTALFPGAGTLNPSVTTLTLGADIAIRDLAVVSDGLLILGGRARSVPGRATLFHWNDTTGMLKTLGVLSIPVDKNPEGLLLLQEDPEFIRVLVMYDGETNGAPLEYFIPL